MQDYSVDSELKGLTRKAGKGDSTKFKSDGESAGSSACAPSGYDNWKNHDRSVSDRHFDSDQVRNVREMRGKDVFRVDPLKYNDAQERILFRGHLGEDTRANFKDTHKPVLPDITTMFHELV